MAGKPGFPEGMFFMAALSYSSLAVYVVLISSAETDHHSDANCLFCSFRETEETSRGVHQVPAFPEAR